MNREERVRAVLEGREPDRIIPWEAVKRFGEDIILVEDLSPPSLL